MTARDLPALLRELYAGYVAEPVPCRLLNVRLPDADADLIAKLDKLP